MNKPANKTVSQNKSPNGTMTVEEARKAMWLRSNYKPLGQLLDEGYLSRGRLEWAAANAYNPSLRQAAQILLERQEQSLPEPVINKQIETLSTAPSAMPVSVSMTLEQARAIVWPFSPYKGRTIGTLVETKQISLKDLGFAIENAWEERVRQAAITLMLIRLNQAVKEPEPSAGFLHIVSSGRSFSERRQLFLNLVQGLLMGIPFGGAIVGFIWSLARTNWSAPSKPFPDVLKNPLGIAVLIIVLAVFFGLPVIGLVIFNRIMNGLDKRIANHRKGQEGEDSVIAVISQSLDGNWYLFRDLVLPGRSKGDLDAVLIGPSGVWVLEIKTFTGEYRNIGEQWEYRAGNRWKLSKSNPSRQVQNNAIRLSSFLKADNIQQWITPAVVWANPDSPLTVENPTTTVWSLDRLADELGNIWHGETIAEPKRNQIIEKLKKLSKEREQFLNQP
ncbi:MAG: nuclease-related domain-containing protein [Chloroflexota bacterium]